MFYVNPDTLEIVTLEDLKLVFPNISFGGNGPTSDFISSIGLMNYNPHHPMPEYDENTECVYQDGINLNNDHYIPNYVVRDLTEDELNRKNEIVWDQVRQTRDSMIREVMWIFERYNTQTLANTTTTNTPQEIADLAIYVQALRDITNQEDPNNITWPINPLV